MLGPRPACSTCLVPDTENDMSTAFIDCSYRKLVWVLFGSGKINGPGFSQFNMIKKKDEYMTEYDKNLNEDIDTGLALLLQNKKLTKLTRVIRLVWLSRRRANRPEQGFELQCCCFWCNLYHNPHHTHFLTEQCLSAVLPLFGGFSI